MFRLHILHNAIKHGISFLDVPVESVVTLIYDRFSISAARIESLKEFTEFVHLECLPAIGRLLVMFDAVFAYFVSMEKEDCPRQTAKMLGATFNGTPEDNGNEVRIYLNLLPISQRIYRLLSSRWRSMVSAGWKYIL